jgi:UDP-N-acetyl-D-mannosaminuronate dehydrogenase
MEYPIKTHCIVGLSYIGLTTATALWESRLELTGANVNGDLVEAVKWRSLPLLQARSRHAFAHDDDDIA